MFIVSLTYHQPIDVVEALTENHKDWLKNIMRKVSLSPPAGKYHVPAALF